jgi:hypothetical protein
MIYDVGTIVETTKNDELESMSLSRISVQTWKSYTSQEQL